MNVNYITLENGLKVCLILKKEVNSVTLHLKGLAGSNFEQQGQIGAAHILEHFNTSQGAGNKLISKGGRTIGITSRDDVLFMVKVSKEYVLDGLEFLAHIFNKEIITETELDRLKAMSVQEIKRIRSNPEKLLGRISCATIFPYGRTAKLNIGEETYLDRLAITDVLEFRDSHYQASSFVLVVSGNFVLSIIVPYIKKLFGHLQAGLRSQYLFPKYNDGFVIKNYLIKASPQTLAKLDFNGFLTSDDKKYEGILIASIVDSLLNKLLKDRLGLSYAVKCTSFSAGSYGIFSIYFSCDLVNLPLLIKEVRRVIANFQTIISTRTVETAKIKVATDYTFSLEDSSHTAEYYSDLLLHGRKDQNLEYELKKIKTSSYSDIKKVSVDLFSQHPKITVISPLPCEDEIKKAWLVS